MENKLRIGTRGSPLALAQAREVETYLLAAHPHLVGHIEIIPIETTGDKMVDRPLMDEGGKVLFTKEIEDALLDGRVDLAVHSMKDVATESPEGLIIPCILPREDPRDGLIVSGGRRLDQLPEGSKLGTSSLRRQSLILSKYSHIDVVPIRGNVGTRLKKIEAGEADATILAMAGLNRLGLVNVANEALDVDDFIPAMGQGAVGVQCREDNERAQVFLHDINDEDTFVCIQAERALMKFLDGSCRTPMGGYAEVHGQVMTLRGFKSEPDGSRMERVFLEGVRDEAETLGFRAAQKLLFKS